MRKGFTLVELLIVVIVIGILAAFAIPQYMNAVEKAKVGSAKNSLGLVAQAQKMRYAERDGYETVSNGGFNASQLNEYVELGPLDIDSYWDYSTGPVGGGFDVTATRTGGGTTYNTTTVTIDQDGVWGGTHPFAQ